MPNKDDKMEREVIKSLQKEMPKKALKEVDDMIKVLERNKSVEKGMEILKSIILISLSQISLSVDYSKIGLKKWVKYEDHLKAVKSAREERNAEVKRILKEEFLKDESALYLHLIGRLKLK